MFKEQNNITQTAVMKKELLQSQIEIQIKPAKIFETPVSVGSVKVKRYALQYLHL